MALFGYAIFFSLAYVRLSAAVGALILFPTVQITMIGGSLLQGNRVTVLQWIGVVISFLGLLYLLSPGLSAPPIIGTAMMIISGASWGVYSLLGKHQERPILSTARNFLFTLPAVVVIAAFAVGPWLQTGRTQLTVHGVVLAVISGAVTSGIGYILWYLTVRRISTTVASVSQLIVPILVAAGGVIFLHEHLTGRLVVSAILIIGGIVLTIVKKRATGPSTDRSPAGSN
jgi:drug/metabolite transporter (DMT)-like permease